MSSPDRGAVAAYVRRNLTAYKRLLYKRYTHAPHLEHLDAALMQLSVYAQTRGARGVGRLIVEMPPRHGKTLTTSRLFPTWHLGRNPDHRVMLVSYGASLAGKNSRAARNIMQSPRYRDTFGIELDAGSKAADAWDIAGHEGGCDAMGIGGAATGKGAHVLVIDDALKNREEAESDTIREKVWDAYTDDLYTRLEPGGAVIVMATRWHMDDLTGRLLRNEPDKWQRIRLPAFAEPDDPLDRQEGAALWPARFDRATLDAIQQTLGPYSWAALYQQDPVPAEGGLFRRGDFGVVDYLPRMVTEARYWDLAMSARNAADYTAGVRMGWGEDGKVYVIDVQHIRLEWGDVVPYIARTAIQDGPHVSQGVEEAGFMSRAVQELNTDPRLAGHNIWGYPVDKDKFTRALPFAARVAAGSVSVLRAGWTDAYLDEMVTFPNAAHDDQVDASSGAWSMIGDGGVLYGWSADAANIRAIAGAY